MIKTLPERLWFKIYQDLLVRMAQTDFGKDLLGIDKSLPRIVRVLPESVTGLREDGQFVSEIHGNSDWCTTILDRIDQFHSFSRYFINRDEGIVLSKLVRYSRSLVATTHTFNPEANPATNALDGSLSYGISNPGDTFTNIRNHAGNSSNQTSTSVEPYLGAATTSNQYIEIDRAPVYFYTGPTIPTTDSINAATFSLYGKSITNNLSQSVGVTAITPGSPTSIANSDYNIANQGSTDYVTRISLGSLSTSVYNDFTVISAGLAGITKGGTGVTYYCVRFSGDIDNNAPTWSSGAVADFQANSADNASNKPKLVVTHAVATNTSNFFFSS